MQARPLLAIAMFCGLASPAIAGPVSTPNLAGGLGTILAPPSAPVTNGNAAAPTPGSAPASGGSAYVSSFVSAYTGGDAAGASAPQGQNASTE